MVIDILDALEELLVELYFILKLRHQWYDTSLCLLNLRCLVSRYQCIEDV